MEKKLSLLVCSETLGRARGGTRSGGEAWHRCFEVGLTQSGA